MPRILIADDEPLIAMILEDWLIELSCETLGPAGSVREALALIEGNRPDAAILDVRLSDGPSYTIAERLRTLGVPFAFASGQDAADIDPRFKDAPMLSKPFDLENIRRVVISMVPGHAA